jgi:hypothetical protein
MNMHTHSLLMLSLCLAATSRNGVAAFAVVRIVGTSCQRHASCTGCPLFYSDRDKNYLNNDGGMNNNNRSDDFDTDTLRDRLERLRVQILDEEFQRPPNPNLSPTEFIQECLHCLWANGDPLPDSGFRLLLRASTKAWRKKLHQSVGAPVAAHVEVVASALGEAICRPNNQFGILVGEAETYTSTFPTDPLDYADGTCWVECQLRGSNDGKLLVITGWQLEKENGAWMVDSIDWQDFRDAFRPGIGREEWMRICG